MTKRRIASDIVFWLRKSEEYVKTNEKNLACYSQGNATALINVAFEIHLISFDMWKRLYNKAINIV